MARKRLVAGSALAISSAATASAFWLQQSPNAQKRRHGTMAEINPASTFPSTAFQTVSNDSSSTSLSLWKEISEQLFSKFNAKNDADATSTKEDSTEMANAISDTLRSRFRVGDSYVWLYRDVDGNPTSWEKYTITGIDESATIDENDNDENAIAKRPGFVATIEMSTKFEEEEAYQTHHRIRANLIDHVMKSSESKEDWRIGFEFFLPSSSNANDDSERTGDWKPFGKGDNVQAFEEKFDVFSMVEAAATATAAKVNEVTSELEKDQSLASWSMTKSTQCEEAKIAIKSAELAIGDNPGATKLVQTKRHGYTEAWFGPSNHKTLSGIALYKEFPHSQHSFSLIETTIAKEGSRDPITDAIKVVV